MARGGIEANQTLRSRFSSAVTTTLEDAGIANKDINSSIDRQYFALLMHHHCCLGLDNTINVI